MDFGRILGSNSFRLLYNYWLNTEGLNIYGNSYCTQPFLTIWSKWQRALEQWGDIHTYIMYKYIHTLHKIWWFGNAKQLWNILFKHPLRLSFPVCQEKKTDILNFDLSVIRISNMKTKSFKFATQSFWYELNCIA